MNHLSSAEMSVHMERIPEKDTSSELKYRIKCHMMGAGGELSCMYKKLTESYAAFLSEDRETAYAKIIELLFQQYEAGRDIEEVSRTLVLKNALDALEKHKEQFGRED